MNKVVILFVFLSGCMYGQQDSIRLWTSDTSFSQQKVFYQDTVVPDFGKKFAYYDRDFTKKAAEFNFFNGRVYGLYKAYYENGTLMEYGVMSNGKFNGEWTLQNEFGVISIKGKYKYGVKHGYWALRYKNCFGKYKEGKINGTWKCYENGQVISKIHYKNGELDKVMFKPEDNSTN